MKDWDQTYEAILYLPQHYLQIIQVTVCLILNYVLSVLIQKTMHEALLKSIHLLWYKIANSSHLILSDKKCNYEANDILPKKPSYTFMLQVKNRSQIRTKVSP